MNIIPNNFDELTTEQKEQMAKLGHSVYIAYQERFIEWQKLDSTKINVAEANRIVENLMTTEVKIEKQ